MRGSKGSRRPKLYSSEGSERGVPVKCYCFDSSFYLSLDLGPLLLVVATDAFELARCDVGTPVFGGMILASIIGIFVITPLNIAFQIAFQAIRERLRPSIHPHVDQKAENRWYELRKDAPKRCTCILRRSE
jgi:hypothetical protein